jgi:glycosidase
MRVRYPTLYQINTRVWLTELTRSLGRRATLEDVPDEELDRIAALGFDWVWLLSVWQIGDEGKRISRAAPELREEFERTLPDLQDEDIQGSGFAITGYTVSRSLGGDAALARLRQRLAARGLKLMLDFVPNHTAVDHPWATGHPEYYVAGTDDDLAREPRNYIRLTDGSVKAHGRDPYFPGWTDTLQLDYSNPATQEAMLAELLTVAERADGVRCDMAMLLLPAVFERTWGRHAEPFWPMAIARVRERAPEFLFLAEVYWDLEWTLLQQGFDYAYDKRLYDRLRERHATPVREHLEAGLDYQDKLARFLENHDEPRAAATFPTEPHRAAAAVTYLTPGLRFFHQGQLEGRTKRISPHLVRRPDEASIEELARFYERLLRVLRMPVLRDGAWQLLECVPAWGGNKTWRSFLAFAWSDAEARLLVVVNYAPTHGQCYVRLPFTDLGESRWRLTDQIGTARYDRDGRELQERGLYLDEPAWRTAVFSLTQVGSGLES